MEGEKQREKRGEKRKRLLSSPGWGALGNEMVADEAHDEIRPCNPNTR